MSSSPRRAALAVCVSLLLVTAGCSGGTDSTTTAGPTSTPPTTSTDTPSSILTPTATTTGTWSPNASVDQYPPGVAANGTLANVTRLLGAHFDETADEPTAFTSRWERSGERYARRLVRGASELPYYSTYEEQTDEGHLVDEFYATDSHGFSRITLPNSTRYEVVRNATPTSTSAWTRTGIAGPRESLRSTLVAGNYRVNGTVERDGRTFVQLTADNVSAYRAELFESYEGRVLVTPDGVVYDVDESFDQERDDELRHTEVSMTLERGIEWTGPPTWVADLPHLSVSPVEDGGALELRNTGGAAIAANASFDVAVVNRTVWSPPRQADAGGTVTLDAPLEPGDSVYVTVDTDGNETSATLHDEPASGEHDIVAAMISGTHDDVFYQVTTGVVDNFTAYERSLRLKLATPGGQLERTGSAGVAGFSVNAPLKRLAAQPAVWSPFPTTVRVAALSPR